VHGRCLLLKSAIKSDDEAEVPWCWKILMIVEAMLFGSLQSLILLQTKDVGDKVIRLSA
jgi:hypothetical protein